MNILPEISENSKYLEEIYKDDDKTIEKKKTLYEY